MLKSRAVVPLTRPVVKADPRTRDRRGEIACDEALFESLRQLRKELADARDVPAYVIFSDTSLRWMARSYPTTTGELARISGVGERKLREFGEAFLRVIADYLRTHPRQTFAPVPLAESLASAPRPARVWKRMNRST